MDTDTAGCYLLHVGSRVYVGSSSCITKRVRDHLWRLRKGEHHNRALQDAWNESGGKYSVEIAESLPGATRDELRASEQRKLDELKSSPALCNISSNSRGPDKRPDMTAKWQDPAWRKFISSRVIHRVVSDETRAKQAEAKRGSRNHKARQVEVVTPDLNKRLFDTATEAASFLGVTQQLVDQWLSGKVALPGQGRTCRKTHLIGLQIRYT